MLVKRLTTPATTLADTTIFQSTELITTLEPITPIAACAIVLTALTLAALNHSIVFTFGLNTQFLNMFFTSIF
jgi:hypothetical protein